MKYEIYDEGANTAKELELRFEGRGQHIGWTFEQVVRTNHGYIYKRTSPDVEAAYYEAFSRKVEAELTKLFPNGNVLHLPRMVMYPSDSAFGEWAFCCSTLQRALDILKSFESRQLENDATELE